MANNKKKTSSKKKNKGGNNKKKNVATVHNALNETPSAAAAKSDSAVKENVQLQAKENNMNLADANSEDQKSAAVVVPIVKADENDVDAIVSAACPNKVHLPKVAKVTAVTTPGKEEEEVVVAGLASAPVTQVSAQATAVSPMTTFVGDTSDDDDAPNEDGTSKDVAIIVSVTEDTEVKRSGCELVVASEDATTFLEVDDLSMEKAVVLSHAGTEDQVKEEASLHVIVDPENDESVKAQGASKDAFQEDVAVAFDEGKRSRNASSLSPDPPTEEIETATMEDDDISLSKEDENNRDDESMEYSDSPTKDDEESCKTGTTGDDSGGRTSEDTLTPLVQVTKMVGQHVGSGYVLPYFPTMRLEI